MKYVITLIALIALLFTLNSCKKDNLIEEYIANEKNEYWVEWSVKYQKRIFEGNCCQYYKDKTFKIFINNTSNELTTPALFKKKRTWDVTEDSLLIEGNFKRKIITINDNVMVLSHPDLSTGKSSYVILIKEKIDKNHRSTFECEDNNRKYIAPMLLDFSKVKK